MSLHGQGGYMHRRHPAVIALVSLTLMPLEPVWTRIFAAEFFYTFAFLVLWVAVPGPGPGAPALRLAPWFKRDSIPGIALIHTGLWTIVCPLLVFHLGLDFTHLFSDRGQVLRFVAAALFLYLPAYLLRARARSW